DLGSVRRPSGIRRQHVVDLAEVVRGHNAGAGDRKKLGVFGPAVFEAVYRAARDAEGLASANVERPVVNPPGRDAFKPVDRLFKGVVTVWRGHVAAGRNEALEDAQASIRIGGFNEEAHTEGTYLNHFRRCCT